MSRSRGVNDPTIPKKRKVARGGNAAERGIPNGALEGRLVDYGDRLVLQAEDGNNWDASRVRMLSGAFGSAIDGVERGPRPWKFGPSNEVLVQGDVVVIEFLDGKTTRPFIRGGVRPLVPVDEGYFARQPIGQNPNRWAMRQVQLDEVGTETGAFDMEVFRSDSEQQVEISVRVGGARCRILLDGKAGTISIGDGSETERVILGDDYLTDYQTVVDDLIAVGIAAGAPTPGAVAVSGKLAADPSAYRGKVKVS
jgi:hypothetical protein